MSGPVPLPTGPTDRPRGTAGRCLRPVWTAVTAPRRVVDLSEIQIATRDAWQYVRCRKCAECKRERKRMWIARAIAEARQAPVTWLFTGTFACEPPDEAAVVREGQRFLKRLRKGLAHPVETYRGPMAVPGVKVRFLSVVERGDENGRLHWHAIIHGDGDLVRWLQLRTAWHAGHMHARRVNARGDERLPDDVLRQIAYVAGYLGKQPGRVVASLKYGRRTPQPTKAGSTRMEPNARSARSPTTSSATKDAPHATTMARPDEGRTTGGAMGRSESAVGKNSARPIVFPAERGEAS